MTTWKAEVMPIHISIPEAMVMTPYITSITQQEGFQINSSSEELILMKQRLSDQEIASS